MARRIEISTYGDPSVMHYTCFEPGKPGIDQVLVANKAIGINHIDTYIRSGLYPAASLPTGLGTEGAGVVTEVGNSVKNVKLGDRVAYYNAPLGAYSDYHIVPADDLIKLPNEISFEQAACTLLKGLTVYCLFNLTYAVKPGEKFLFYAAAGGVGLIACQWAKTIGAKLIGTVGSDEKRDIAETAGAWRIINHSKNSVYNHLMELTENHKVNVVYDSVGKDTWLTSLNCLRRRGLMVSFGNTSGPVTGIDLGLLNQKGSLYVTRPSVFNYFNNVDEMKHAAASLFDLIISGDISLGVEPKQIFSLKEASFAHESIQLGKTIGQSILVP